MLDITLGIIGSGQLGSLLCQAAKTLKVKTIVISDDEHGPAQDYADQFIFSKYDNKDKIEEFVGKVDIVTYEFENIPVEILNRINKEKTGLGLSKQSWFLKDKILDAHNAIEQGLYLKEGHPECSFAALSGKPIENSKKTPSGIITRLLCLQEIGFNFKRALKNFPPNMEIKTDDFLDAAILCWTATRVDSNSNFTFPPKNENDTNPFDCIIYI